MTNSPLDSLPQLPAAGAWGSLYGAVQEPVKSRPVSVVVPSPAKKPAYGVKRNLDMCTEALGCETGGVDAAADEVDDGAERKRRATEEDTKVEAIDGRVRRVLPPPLTTLAAGASRVRMVHERRGGRLEVYAVRASGMEAERSGGRLRLRFLLCDGCNAAKCNQQQQESQEAEEEKTEEVDLAEEDEEEEYVVATYMRGGRCVEAEGGATAARRGKKWEQEQAAAFWVAIT